METHSAGKYTIEISESENTQTFLGVTKNLWNIAITNNETNQTIEISDITSPKTSENWCDIVFRNAKEGLDSEEGPSCCYVNAAYRS